MLDRLDPTAGAGAAGAVGDAAGPEPMRLDAARGQQPRPPMDAPSTVRLRASASGGEAAANRRPGQAEPSAARTAAAHPPSSRDAVQPGFNPIKLFAKMMTGVLALSSGYRLARYPGDFAKDPGGSLWAAVNMAHRSSPNDLKEGNRTVLERYGAYIPDDSLCFKAKADIVLNKPMQDAGTWSDDKQQLEVNANVPLNSHPAAVAQHEFIHCYTHPEFRARYDKHEHWTALNEGLTTHLTDKLPNPNLLLPLAKVPYHDEKLSTGDTWPQAAQRIEAKVGEETLLKAFFGGDSEALGKVSVAAAQIYPKLDSSRTEAELYRAGSLRGSQQLAECYVGALMIAGQPLPDSWTRNMLSVFSFSEIPPEQAQRMQAQAEQSRQRMGGVFDAAFFAPDRETQRQSLGMLREDLLMHWEPVLDRR